MASRVFTERFVASTLMLQWVDYIVPAGYRAILRNVAAVNFLDQSCVIQVVAGPTVMAAHTFPALADSWFFETRAVAYAGEPIRSFMNSANGAVTLTGYLFRDLSSRATQLPAPDVGPWPDPIWGSASAAS